MAINNAEIIASTLRKLADNIEEGKVLVIDWETRLGVIEKWTPSSVLPEKSPDGRVSYTLRTIRPDINIVAVHPDNGPFIHCPKCAKHNRVRFDIHTKQAWCESCKHGWMITE